MKYLCTISHYGFDVAYYAMQKRKNSKKNIYYEKQAAFGKTRYNSFLKQEEVIKNRIISSSINSLKFVPEEILNIPFRAFVSPLGKGKFLKLGSALPNSVQTRDIVNFINGDIDVPHKLISEVSQFKSQAVASIVFHSISFVNSDKLHNNEESLDYLFSKEKTPQEISNILFQILPYKYHEAANLNETHFIPHPIKNLTADAMQRLVRWKPITFSQLLKDCMFFPIFLDITDNRYSISNIKYPSNIRKLSIFSLNSITNKQNVKNKIKTLYTLGFRTIGSILMLEEKYRVYFLSKYSDDIVNKVNDEKNSNDYSII